MKSKSLARSANYGIWLRRLAVLTIMSVAIPTLHAQPTSYRITFVDKGQIAFEPGSALYEQTLSEFHPDAIARRQRTGKQPLLDTADQPLSSDYLNQLRNLGIRPRVPMRWRNSVLADLDVLQAGLIRQLPFVASVVPTSSQDYRTQSLACGAVDPGPSIAPHRLLNTLPLLEAGVSGTGSTVCLIDNGFRTAEMSSLQHLTVRASFDAVQDDSVVYNQDGDPGSQDGHGSIVLSIAAGWQPGELVGIAPFATYLLAKSEDMRFEQRIEEDLYTAAVEWAERNGANVVSSSLGYFGFDSTEQPLDYAVLDGKTTFAARAINRAAQVGMLCVTAAGNSGPQDSTIGIPADADSVIAVGGTMADGSTYRFTSQGPTADGRSKPDVSAMAGGVRSQALDGSFIVVSGTSMAAPQIAGVLALLQQLYGELPAWTIRDALYASSATRADSGEVTGQGRGLPDVLATARRLGQQHGPGIGPPSVVEVAGGRRVLCAVFAETFPSVTLEVRGLEQTFRADVVSDLWYNVDVTEPLASLPGDTIWGRLWADGQSADGHRTRRAYPSDSTWFAIPRTGTLIPCGVKLPGTVTSVAWGASTTPAPSTPARTLANIVPNPIAADQRWVEITGIRATNTITVVATSSGAVVTDGAGASRGHVHWTTRADGRIAVQLPDLVAGHYMVVVSSPRQRFSLPLVVY